MYRVPSDFKASEHEADVNSLFDDISTTGPAESLLNRLSPPHSTPSIEPKECWPGADWWEYPHGETAGQVTAKRCGLLAIGNKHDSTHLVFLFGLL